jgi:hypothetical protein
LIAVVWFQPLPVRAEDNSPNQFEPHPLSVSQNSVSGETLKVPVPLLESVPQTDWQGERKPLLKVGTNQSAFNLGATESTIAWERWHHRVGKALHKSVERVTRTSLGEVILMITVTNDCKISAIVLSASNPKIGEACLAGTKNLDGDTILIFPQESKRHFVKFKFEYRRGIFLWPHNHYITDDFERLDDSAKNVHPAGQ